MRAKKNQQNKLIPTRPRKKNEKRPLNSLTQNCKRSGWVGHFGKWPPTADCFVFKRRPTHQSDVDDFWKVYDGDRIVIVVVDCNWFVVVCFCRWHSSRFQRRTNSAKFHPKPFSCTEILAFAFASEFVVDNHELCHNSWVNCCQGNNRHDDRTRF